MQKQSQEIPGVIGKFGLGVQTEAGQRLKEFCQENTLVMANTLFQNTRDNSTYGCHQMGNTKIRLIMLFEAEDGVTLYTYQKHDGEMIVTQIMNSLLQNSDLNRKNQGKTTRPFRYHLNQIPYDYTVEVMNRFKGLDLVDRLPEELWMEVCNIVQEAVTKTIPKEKK